MPAPDLSSFKVSAGEVSSATKFNNLVQAIQDEFGDIDPDQITGSTASPSVTPVSLVAPSGGAFWTVSSLGAAAWLAPHWEFPDGATGRVDGDVLVPAGVTNATLRVLLAANATTGTAVVGCKVGSVADGENLAMASFAVVDTTANVAMPGTAFLRKDQTFSLTGLAGGDLLPVAITRVGGDGADSLTANLLLLGAWLEPA